MSSSVNQQQQDNADKRKLKWTYILHYEFMDAVDCLGGIMSSNATANKIWSLMNMPGLTNEHVRSHLQKIRKLYTSGPKRMNTNAKIHLIYLLANPGRARTNENWSCFLSACKECMCRSSSNNNDNNTVLSPENINIHDSWKKYVLDAIQDFLMSDDNVIGQVNLDEEKLKIIVAEFASVI